MLAKLRPRSAYDVMAALALFIALATGSAYAANTVFSTDIVDGQVKGPDIAANAVGSGKIADRQVKNADLSSGASSSNTIADGGVLSTDIRDDNLTGADLLESSLGKVPDADTLDGKDSASFMEGRAVYNRVVQADTGGDSPATSWSFPASGRSTGVALPMGPRRSSTTLRPTRSRSGSTTARAIPWARPSSPAVAAPPRSPPIQSHWTG